MKYISTALFIIISLSNLQSQKKWTLQECFDYAFENNIDLKMRSLQIDNYDNLLDMSKKYRLPDLNLRAGQGLNFGRSPNPGTGVYEQRTATNTNVSLNSNFNVYSGSRIKHNIATKTFDLMAATENMKKARENMELNIVSYYLDVLFKKEILKIYNEQAIFNKQQVERTQILVESGSIPLSQLYDIKAQYANDLLNVTNSENDLTIALLNLSQLLNYFKEDFDIIEPEIKEIFIKRNDTPEDIYQKSITIKPHIKEIEFRLKGSESKLKYAKSDYLPTIGLGLSYYNDFAFALQSKYKGFNEAVYEQWKQNARQAINLSINIPVFNRFQTKGQVKSAQLEVQNAHLELEQTKNDLYKEIKQAYQSVISAQAKYEATNVSLEAAEQSFKYATERYDAGKSTVFEYNEAQTKLIKSKSEKLQAIYDFIFKNKILDFYKGIPIEL